MVLPRFVGRYEQARQAAASADINASIATALDMYELNNGQYPDKLDDLITDSRQIQIILCYKGFFLTG